MNARRILVANELTSYRETITVVIRELHPNVVVFEAEPEKLDREVARLRPDLVICSRVTPLVRDMVPNWVELYPDCEPLSTLCIGGERTAMEDIQLSDLLSLCASPL
jgi:hypothetical protein